VRRYAPADLPSILALLGGEDAVIKPAVSGAAWRTWRVSDFGIAKSQAKLQILLGESDMLIQRYEPQVVEQGEWSLVFIGGAYGHAVLKRPKPGDFRSPEKFGSTIQGLDASPSLRRAAERALAMLGQNAAYARVDIIDSPEGPLLMEVELIEPVLYFNARPETASDLVKHLERRIAHHDRGDVQVSENG
jgi:glutathione synthase/RimK-type ligase-like ATP-grasp enzyme